MNSSATNQLPPSKLQTPEFLLGMVIFFMLWAIGLVDLLTHTDSGPNYKFFGPYTLTITAMLAAYVLLFLLWLVLLLVPRSHLWLQRQIQKIQSRTWLILLVFAAIGSLIWSLFRFKKWDEFPGLGLALFCMALLIGIILLLTGWSSYGKGQGWRKLIGIPIGLFLLVEIVTQGAAYAGVLPPVTINNGLYVPRGRIYQSEQGLANGQTNSAGWYYPEFRLDGDGRRILLMGDTFVQGLQVAPEQNLGVHLDQFVQAAAQQESGKAEVFALGMPGFGPGVYLSETRITHAIERFEPDEIILLFHLANDFQLVSEPSGYELYYEVNDEGKVDVSEGSWDYRHDLQHVILHGYEPGLTPLKTLATHVLSTKLVTRLLEEPHEPTTADPMNIPNVISEVTSTRRVDQNHTDVTSYRLIARPGKSNFLFEKEGSPETEEPYAVAVGLLRQTNDFLKSEGVQFRIVTIPAFPPAFFEAEGTEWSAELGPYDLFTPERVLADFASAEGIDFLPMGQRMQNGNLSIADVQSLYFNSGQGHFSPAGHRYFAESIFDCFYNADSEVPCRP